MIYLYRAVYKTFLLKTSVADPVQFFFGFGSGPADPGLKIRIRIRILDIYFLMLSKINIFLFPFLTKRKHLMTPKIKDEKLF